MSNNSKNTSQAISKEKIDYVLKLYSNGRYSEAISAIQSLDIDYPNVPLLYNLLGVCYKSLGKFQDSLKAFEKAIKIKPDYAEVYNNLGLTYLQLNELDNAVMSFENATSYMPNFNGAHYNLGIALKELGRLEEAANSYNKVIELTPENANAHNNLGAIYKDLGRFDLALESYNQAIIFNSEFAEAFNNLGVLLRDLGKLNESIDNFQKALSYRENFAEAYYNQGKALFDLNQNTKAIESFKNAISAKPDYVEAYNNLGVAYKEINELNASVEFFGKAISLKSDFAEAHNNLGLAFANLGQMTESIECFKSALKYKSNYAYAYNNFGSALKQMGKFKASVEYYNKALAINPNSFEVHNNLGNVFKYLKKHNESLKSYEHTYELNPDADYIIGNITHAYLHLCSWSRLSNFLNEFPKKISNGEKVVDPFPLLSIIDNPELQQKCAEIFINHKFPENFDLPKILPYSGHDKIRIGYFSPDFRIHPVANLTAELYEIHDRNKFEVHAFSFGPDTNDEMNLRIKSGVDHFHDVRLMSHKEVALLARSVELDIAVDLGGFTQDTRTGIFAMRAAPIQVNYLGYSGTMGAEYIDYLISDSTLVPEDKQQYYTEKIAYLPDSFMVNDTKNKVSVREFTRKKAGLPEKGFVFSCFNHHYKITPSVFSSWMKILGQVEESVLWLSDGNNTGISNLKNEAEKRGIDSKRLIFAPRLDLREDHLNRIRLSDLFLDTLPYNAHATTSDALQVGLPVLTRIGESFASRVAASLINSVNLPELITETQEQYEEMAIGIAKDTEKLKSIREKLKSNLPLSPLYNTPLYVKQLESAYQEMYKRSQKGLEPDHIYV